MLIYIFQLFQHILTFSIIFDSCGFWTIFELQKNFSKFPNIFRIFQHFPMFFDFCNIWAKSSFSLHGTYHYNIHILAVFGNFFFKSFHILIKMYMPHILFYFSPIPTERTSSWSAPQLFLNVAPNCREWSDLNEMKGRIYYMRLVTHS